MALIIHGDSSWLVIEEDDSSIFNPAPNPPPLFLQWNQLSMTIADQPYTV